MGKIRRIAAVGMMAAGLTSCVRTSATYPVTFEGEHNFRTNVGINIEGRRYRNQASFDDRYSTTGQTFKQAKLKVESILKKRIGKQAKSACLTSVPWTASFRKKMEYKGVERDEDQWNAIVDENRIMAKKEFCARYGPGRKNSKVETSSTVEF